MEFTIQMVIKDEHGNTKTEDIIALDKQIDSLSDIGLSIGESKSLLKTLQKIMVTHQAEKYTAAHTDCSRCHKKRRTKGYHGIQYITLFGIVSIPCKRVYTGCHGSLLCASRCFAR